MGCIISVPNSNSQTHQNSTQQDNAISNGSEGDSSQSIYFDQLGIITSKPKTPEYAVLAHRLHSFREWPKRRHLKPGDLAAAGFFYTGTGDCARCFHCGGILTQFEPEDNVWVEHASWFPHCAFLSQKVGKEFIDFVQEMKKEAEVIKYEDVIERMGIDNVPSALKLAERIVQSDAAVLAVIDNRFDKREVTKLAMKIHRSGEQLSSDKLFKAAQANNLPFMHDTNNLASDSVSIRQGGNEELDGELIKTLRQQNSALRQQSMCTICMDTDVAVVFLPCGHLVSCAECSFALEICPLCRLEVKGVVKCSMGK